MGFRWSRGIAGTPAFFVSEHAGAVTDSDFPLFRHQAVGDGEGRRAAVGRPLSVFSATPADNKERHRR
jgi:diadenosine tetraphosphatase ApaH/serine/threonine PP2A family protein phosphatase